MALRAHISRKAKQLLNNQLRKDQATGVKLPQLRKTAEKKLYVPLVGNQQHRMCNSRHAVLVVWFCECRSYFFFHGQAAVLTNELFRYCSTEHQKVSFVSFVLERLWEVDMASVILGSLEGFAQKAMHSYLCPTGEMIINLRFYILEELVMLPWSL